MDSKKNYKTEFIELSKIKPNPDNPRIIKNDKFNKLVQSIKDFPEMLNIRPIVVNKDNMILGGNMRLKAAKDAGLKAIPVLHADDLTNKQQKEFIIKDNVGFGEWDMDDLSKNWNADELNNWGLDLPEFNETIESNETEIMQYNKIHFLLSFNPNLFEKVKPLIDELIKLEGLEYEQSAN